MAVDGERAPGRHLALVRRLHHERAQAAELLLQQADRVLERACPERVAAHELGEVVAPMRRRPLAGPHLVERHRHAAAGELVRRLAAREARADHHHALAGRRSPHGRQDSGMVLAE